MYKKIAYCLIASLGFAFVPGCGDDDDDDDGVAGSANAGRGGGGRGGAGGTTAGGMNTGGGGRTGGTGGMATGGMPTGGMTGEGGTGGAVAMLTDPEILHVVIVANTGEVEQGQIAEKSAQTPEVQAFAEMMIEHHSAGKAEAVALAEQLDLTPDGNPVSSMLQAKSDQIVMTLEAAADMPDTFDQVYMESQVMVHAEVLTLIDEVLLPQAEEEDVAALLTMMRAQVQTHLEEAETILEELE